MNWDAINAGAGWFGALVATAVFVESRWRQHVAKRQEILAKLSLETSGLASDALLLTVIYRPGSSHTRYSVQLTVADTSSNLSIPAYRSRSDGFIIIMPSLDLAPDAPQSKALTLAMEEEGSGELRAHAAVHCRDRKAKITVAIINAADGSVALRHSEAVTA